MTRRERQSLEAKLLEAEKSKNGLSVDLAQLRQQLETVKSELSMEKDKVCTVHRFLAIAVPFGFGTVDRSKSNLHLF